MRLVILFFIVSITLLMYLEVGFTTESGSNHLDTAKMARATAVARVKFIRMQGGSKYTWELVQVLEVIKNSSDRKLEGEVSIAHYFHVPGIPQGENIIYLVPYSDAKDSGWKLISEAANE